MLTTEHLKTAWKSSTRHSAYQHAFHILVWAAIREASPERTLDRLKKAFSPIVRPSKLAGNNFKPYNRLQQELSQICTSSSLWISIEHKSVEIEEPQKTSIRNLADVCNRQLEIEARVAKLSMKAAA